VSNFVVSRYCLRNFCALSMIYGLSTNNSNSFVSRANPKNNDKHVILGVIGWKPRDFATQMNLFPANGWGIVRAIADMCLRHGGGDDEDNEDGSDKKLGDAQFVLMKDPNKPLLRLYEVPFGSGDDDEEEEEEVVQPAEGDEQKTEAE